MWQTIYVKFVGVPRIRLLFHSEYHGSPSLHNLIYQKVTETIKRLICFVHVIADSVLLWRLKIPQTLPTFYNLYSMLIEEWFLLLLFICLLFIEHTINSQCFYRHISDTWWVWLQTPAIRQISKGVNFFCFLVHIKITSTLYCSRLSFNRLPFMYVMSRKTRYII